MKKISNNYFFKLFSIVIVSIIIATILMISVYTIPTDRAKNNITNSYNIYSKDIIKTWTGNFRYGKLDTSTDILMINSSICRPYKSVIRNSLLNPQFTNNDVEDPQLVALGTFLENKYVRTIDYPRYWHGYALYMIPGLFLFNLGELRVVMMVAQIVLAMYLFYELSKKNRMLAFAYLVTYLFMNPVTMIMNFALASVHLVTSFMCIVLVKYNDYFIKDDRYVSLFALTGILISFFDFLTYPLVSWGILLVTALIINKDLSYIEKLWISIKGSFAWVFSYIGMWAGKWVVASLLTKENVFKDAYEALVNRTIGTDGVGYKFTYSDVLSKVFETFDRAIISLFVFAILVFLINTFVNKKKIHINKETILEIGLLLLISVSAFVWYFVLMNHTFIHPWYEYRHLAITIYALFAIGIRIFNLN